MIRKTDLPYKRDSWGTFEMYFFKTTSQEPVIPKAGSAFSEKNENQHNVLLHDSENTSSPSDASLR